VDVGPGLGPAPIHGPNTTNEPPSDGAATASEPARPSSWWLLAPAVMCFAIGAFLALRLPVFFGSDERSHFGYVVSVINGELPSLDEPQLFDDRFPIVEASYRDSGSLAHPRPVGVANHPPAAYVIAAPLVRLAALGPDNWPPIAMRLVNAAGMATGVVLTGFFAAAAFPRTRVAGLGSAAVTAVTPTVAVVAAWGQNDGLAFATSAAALYLTVRLLQRRPSATLLGVTALVAALAFLIRSSLGPVAVMLVGAAALSQWRHRTTTRSGLVRALGVGGLVGVVGLSGGAWFLLRNERLYGSPTADTYLLERYHRIPRGDVLDVLTAKRFPWWMFRGLYAVPHHLLNYERASWVLAVLVALCVAGAVAWLVRRGPSLRTGGFGAMTSGERGPLGVAGWLLVAASCAGTYVGTAAFYAEGGAANPRYLFSLVPVLSALLTRAVCELPGARAWLVGTVGLLAAVAAAEVARVPDLVWMLRVPPDWISAAGPASVRTAMLVVAAIAASAMFVGLIVSGRAGPPRASRRSSEDDDVVLVRPGP
jgi:hypothetical protein